MLQIFLNSLPKLGHVTQQETYSVDLDLGALRKVSGGSLRKDFNMSGISEVVPEQSFKTDTNGESTMNSKGGIGQAPSVTSRG